MASANKKSGSSSSGRSAGISGRTSSGGTASGSGSRKYFKKRSVFAILKDSSAGQFLIIITGTICVIGLDFLISLNQFDRFFVLLGVELIVVVLIGWIRFVFHGRNNNSN